ncbi:MAG: 4Fe-4S binding protein [candidate division Zixibacteria bacterium]|nr:4Fe-4S binding protein [candidate division Zixibacteria bacterium]
MMFKIDPEKCLHCGGCVPVCPTDALELFEAGLTCDEERCVYCGDCVLFCPVKALELELEYQV